MEKSPLSRRALLEIGWMALAGIMGRTPLSAASAGDRALVCIYLVGGNDGNNLVVPLDSGQYNAYAALRGELALPATGLLPVRAAATQSNYGLHPAMGELQGLFEQGALAVVANVGAPREGAGKPQHRYDSLGFWPGGYLMLPIGTPIGVFSGVGVSALGGAPAPGRTASLEKQAAAAADSLRTPFPDTGIGKALRSAAGLILASDASGIGRPTLMATMGGFDTHAGQLVQQQACFAELSAAMAAFYAATIEAGIARQVTVFTDSEFGRSLQPNAAHGTDHGWGNHQLVMGGAVLGGDVYGQFPDMLASARDANGGWAPTTPRDRYLSTLALWAGMPFNETSRRYPQARTAASMGFLAG